MNDIFFRPLELFDLQGFLTRHADWLYFALIVALFISIAGITLKKHFDQPYVKPLIITAGLILAVAAFRNKHVLSLIFNGWGTLGYVLLLLIAAMIPYGLAKGFGLPTSRAAWLTYILMYLIAWASFPDLFAMLSDRGMALLNLALFILFFVAIWKVFRLPKKSSKLPSEHDLKALATPKTNKATLEAQKPITADTRPREDQKAGELEVAEAQSISKEAAPVTEQEIKTVDDLQNVVSHILGTIKKRGHKLDQSERESLTNLMAEASRQEHLFMAGLQRMKKVFQEVRFLDEKQLLQIRKRSKSANGEERQFLKAELTREKEKLIIFEAIRELESRLKSSWDNFVMYINAGIKDLGSTGRPSDAISNIYLAQKTIKNLRTILLGLAALEKRLVLVIREERDLRKRESKAA